MSKVFVLSYQGYEDFEIMGVYNNREDAQKALDKDVEEFDIGTNEHTSTRRNYIIDELEVQ